jgi:hypothetical protein
MGIVAHHAGEQALAPLLLILGSGGLSLAVAIGRARAAAARARLTRARRGRGPPVLAGAPADREHAQVGSCDRQVRPPSTVARITPRPL